MAITLYSWRQKNSSTGRSRTLRWKMTEADAAEHARVNGVELEKVLGSEELRKDLRGGVMFFNAYCTGAIDARFDDKLARFGPAPAERVDAD